LTEDEKQELEEENYAPVPYYEDSNEDAALIDHRAAEGGDDNFSPAVRALLKSWVCLLLIDIEFRT